MMSLRYLGLGLAGLLLGACASAPVHYYTLVSPAGTPVAASAPFQFELAPVGIPTQADQPQLVVREGAQNVVLLEGERWIAPLGDEVRAALSADLAAQLQAQDVSGLPAGDAPVLRIKLDLRRFDSMPGRYALLDAAWSLRMSKGGATSLACTSQIREPVDAGYDALVQGHQRALARLAGQIAQAGKALASGQSAACPRP